MTKLWTLLYLSQFGCISGIYSNTPTQTNCDSYVMMLSECAVNSAACLAMLLSYAQHLCSILQHMRGSHESMRRMMVEERLAYLLENAYKLFLL